MRPLGAGLGVTDHLQIDVGLTEVALHPDTSLGQPALAVSYGWDIFDVVALFPHIGVAIPIRWDQFWTVSTGLDATWLLTSVFEIGVSPALESTIAQDREMALALPAVFFLQPADRVFFEVSSGPTFSSAAPGRGPDFSAPTVSLSSAAGVSLGHTAGVVHDLVAWWEWPSLWSSGPATGHGVKFWVSGLSWQGFFSGW